MSEAACPICGSPARRRVGPYRSTSPDLASVTEKLACDACGHVFANPMPNDEQWAAYNSSYFGKAHAGEDQRRGAVLFRSGLAKLRLEYIAAVLKAGNVEVRTVLEIGPGHGELAREFLARFPGVRYFGAETDQNLLPALRNLGVTLVQSPAEAGRDVDLVIISHVLEHVAAPIGFLEVLRAGMRAGGMLFVEVPCADHVYKPLDEPHLQFFDKPSMERALGSAGFGEIRLTYHGRPHPELVAESRRGLLAGRSTRMLDRLAALVAPGPVGLDRAEWGILRNFAAEREYAVPSRWLRATATN